MEGESGRVESGRAISLRSLRHRAFHFVMQPETLPFQVYSGTGSWPYSCSLHATEPAKSLLLRAGSTLFGCAAQHLHSLWAQASSDAPQWHRRCPQLQNGGGASQARRPAATSFPLSDLSFFAIFYVVSGSSGFSLLDERLSHPHVQENK